MENNKSQAEIYREERKARLAKEAERKAKKAPKFSKTKRTAGKIIAIVLAVAIGLGAIGGILNFFGVPQKVAKVKVTGHKECDFSVAEFNIFYYNTWNSLCSTAQQYSYYGMNLGFDYTKSPADQPFTSDMAQMLDLDIALLGVTEPTWADVIRYLSTTQLVEIKYLVSLAEKEGMTLTETELQQIESDLEEQRTVAKQNDYSLDRWLRSQIGNGVDEDVFRQIYKEQMLAQKYYEKYEADLEALITTEQINEKYNAEKDQFDFVDARVYVFQTEEPDVADDATDEEKEAAVNKAQEETKAKADAFLAAVVDEESFIAEAKKAILSADSKSTDDPDETTDYSNATYSEFESINEEVAKWTYDDARKTGDKTVIDLGEGSYGVFFIVAPQYRDTSANSYSVRHILVSFPKDENDKVKENITDTEKADCKIKAQAILDEYLKNPTEENFAALAKEKSEDPGSKENGGLYEDLNSSTSFVQPFKDWYLDESRKVGDTGIVETSYGYHIMYFAASEGVAWEETVKSSILTEKIDAFYAEQIESLFPSISNSIILKWAVSAQNKHIEKLIAYSSSSY